MSTVCVSHKSAFKAAKDMVIGLAVFVGVCALAHCNQGCDEAKAVVGDPAHDYATEIIACAATAGYPGAYDREADMRCRDDVNSRYELAGASAKDGGAKDGH